MFGRGPAIALCFHGYGEKAESFVFLENYLSDKFTFYSINLPFHGDTEWREGLDFTETDLVNVINRLIGEQTREITLLGFSLGGRIALTIYQLMPVRIEKMVLMAPDGMKLNFWYWLATQNYPGNRLFAWTMKHPGWFFGILKVLNVFRLVNSSIFKFVRHYISDPVIRDLLYKRWTTLRKLKPDIPAIKNLVKKYKTKIRLIYGQHDRIILSSRAKKFQTGIEEWCTLDIIHSGHQVLHEKHIEEIKPALD